MPLSFLFAMAVIIVSESASGAPRSVKFCFQYSVSYLDSFHPQTGAPVGDYWVYTTSPVARGISARIQQNDPAEDQFNTYTGAETGCTSTLALDDAKTYLIRTRSLAYVAGASLVRVIDPATGTNYWTTLKSAWKPDAATLSTCTYSAGVYTCTFSFATGWTQLAAAYGYSVNKRYGTAPGKIWVAWNDTCPQAGVWSCFLEPNLYIDSDDTLYRFIIAHEFGHQLQWQFDGTGLWDLSLVANVPCESSAGDQHVWRSQEWQTGAATEGWADFVSASVWNDTSGPNCEYDLSDCGDEQRWMETNCQQPYIWTANEGDWARTWWDLISDGGYSFNQLCNTVDAANPNSWHSSNVYSRLRQSAIAYGISSNDWDWVADMLNGVNW